MIAVIVSFVIATTTTGEMVVSQVTPTVLGDCLVRVDPLHRAPRGPREMDLLAVKPPRAKGGSRVRPRKAQNPQTKETAATYCKARQTTSTCLRVCKLQGPSPPHQRCPSCRIQSQSLPNPGFQQRTKHCLCWELLGVACGLLFCVLLLISCILGVACMAIP